ncbi:hypothetical protein DPMN_061798 [Dreissena polymorpha]|uniref:Uncharacterized protein n=1 Tax=Dreissena polymorpha TaxID=45954 RepID=A0A9D4HH81_DREPO|nr:hypothetical protein DPMN_061798 [Dreissena polymorpha]
MRQTYLETALEQFPNQPKKKKITICSTKNISGSKKIAAPFPVTSCECERTISTLGNVKTSCRPTMGEEILTGLCLMSVHRDIDVNLSNIVQQKCKEESKTK